MISGPCPSISSMTRASSSRGSSSTCAFSEPPASSRTRRGCGRCVATPRASRRSRRRSAPSSPARWPAPRPANPSAPRAQKRSRGFEMPKRTLHGVVVSDKQDKTVIVKVERRYTHPMLKKTVRSSKKYYAHDEKNEFSVGDLVWIEERRPLSKLKRWEVTQGEKKKKVG